MILREDDPISLATSSELNVVDQAGFDIGAVHRGESLLAIAIALGHEARIDSEVGFGTAG